MPNISSHLPIYQKLKIANENHDLWIDRKEYQKQADCHVNFPSYETLLRAQNEFAAKIPSKNPSEKINTQLQEQISMFWVYGQLKESLSPQEQEGWREALKKLYDQAYSENERPKEIAAGCLILPKDKNAIATAMYLLRLASVAPAATPVTPTTPTTPVVESNRLKLLPFYEPGPITFSTQNAIPDGFHAYVSVVGVETFNTVSQQWEPDASSTLIGKSLVLTPSVPSITQNVSAPPLDSTKASRIRFQTEMVSDADSTVRSAATQQSIEIVRSLASRAPLVFYGQGITVMVSGNKWIRVSYPTDNVANGASIVPSAWTVLMDLETSIILDPNPDLTPQNPTAPPWIPRLEISGTVIGTPMSKLKVMTDPMLAVDHVITGDFSAIPLGNTVALGKGQCVMVQGNTNIAGNYQFTLIEVAGFIDYSFVSDWQPNTNYSNGNRVRNPIDGKLYRASVSGNFGAMFSPAQFQLDVPFQAFTINIVHQPNSLPINGTTTTNFQTGK
jgi:hypothetical protein